MERLPGAKFLKFVIASIFLVANFANAEIIVVSDLDETIKQTSPGKASTWSVVKRALFSNKVYRGMPELMQVFDRTTDRQYVLTGSPSIIRKSMWRLIRYHDIPIEGLITNRWAPMKKTYPYKYSKLTGLFNYFKDAQFILIGDNTSHDARVYKEMAEKYPGRVLAIYIHKADEKKKDDGVINFYSAYEVAYHEYQAGRMSYQDVEQLYIHIFEANKLSELFPKGGECPKDAAVFAGLNDTSLTHLTRLMTSKVVDFCQANLWFAAY